VSVELVSVEPVLTGTRPALRVVVTDGTGPATVISALTLYPQDPLWATYWFDPATGWYGMGRYGRPDVVDIPRDQVAEIRGMEIAVEAEAPTVDELKRDGSAPSGSASSSSASRRRRRAPARQPG